MSDPADPDRTEIAIDKSIAYIVYALYIIGFLIGGLATVVGVLVAYLARRRASVPLLVSHYTWQIHIFWWSFLAFVIVGVVAGLLIYTLVFWILGLLIGVICLLAITITVVVLSIRGMLDLNKDDWPSERYVI
ncbi:MAG: hypothetical protein OXG15_15870 [Gammaproteobacteria bacterium]|nr:hypothetical protein [Gammaproteobacteria bacterium]